MRSVIIKINRGSMEKETFRFLFLLINDLAACIYVY